MSEKNDDTESKPTPPAKEDPRGGGAKARRKNTVRSSGDRSEPERTDAPSERPEKGLPFPVVGIGASAGGLEALEAFFAKLPPDSGMAFVVVTHTDPNRDSILPTILGRKTRLAVKVIEAGMPVEQNTVFLPPSDRDPEIGENGFILNRRSDRDELHNPIDRFFRSLAEYRGEQTAGVILSGTGTDGSHGIRPIKEKAGLTLAQTVSTARHSGMPSSAIETGLIDITLPPEEMPGRLIEYFRDPGVNQMKWERDSPKKPDPIAEIIKVLADQTGHDFSMYKRSTLKRRLERRLAATRARSAEEYTAALSHDPVEARTLFQSILIGVTSFFRDPETFVFLQEHVLDDLFSPARNSHTLRVWVPGCATGEEAYSVAIMLKEYMAAHNLSRELQIFGTDIDLQAIEKARRGEYLQNIAAEVGEKRLKRFFVQRGDGYRVARELREPVVFAEQNLLRDPPFSDLDMLLCRNLLIYLKPEAQKKLIPLFHYVLRKDGVLILGNSEAVSQYSQLFEPCSKSHRIYRKKETLVPPEVRFPDGKLKPASSDDADKREFAESGPAGSLDKSVEHFLLKEFVPACMILDQGGEIVHTHGRTGKYLELGEGKPSLNIAEMAREGLRFPLIAALRRAKTEDGPFRYPGLRVKVNGGFQWIDLTVKRFNRPSIQNALLAVFQEVADPAETVVRPPEGVGDDQSLEHTEALERELVRVKQEYRNAREELQSANEELRSGNEEMQSSNEELQSTNEELESSREELQSLNEELNTVNDELQNKIEELNDQYRIINETLNSTRIAMIFLDSDLRVDRFTQSSTHLINLIESDIRRPLGHISHNLELEDLSALAARVLKTLEPCERDVQTTDGHWYRMSIRIHRTRKRTIEGVVLTFVNIDAQKNAQQKIEAMKNREINSVRRFAKNVFDTIREALVVLDDRMRIVSANRRFYDNFHTDPKQTEGVVLFELGNGQWDIPELRNLLRETSQKQTSFDDFLVKHTFPDIGVKKMLLNCRYLEEDIDEHRILLAIEDISERAMENR